MLTVRTGSLRIYTLKPEYRANYATTLLRTVWGKAGQRLMVFPLPWSIVSTIQCVTCIEFVRALLFCVNLLGHPDLDLLRGDISDERIAIARDRQSLNPIT